MSFKHSFQRLIGIINSSVFLVLPYLSMNKLKISAIGLGHELEAEKQ